MTTQDRTEIEAIVSRYADAWNAHDLDAIMSFHADDGTFCLHADGEQAVGREAIREVFAESLRQWHGLRFESRRLLIGDGFLSHEMTFRATSDDGREVSFDMTDVITMRDGLILTKDTYADATALARQLAA